jgi:hypothetical protein
LSVFILTRDKQSLILFLLFPSLNIILAICSRAGKTLPPTTQMFVECARKTLSKQGYLPGVRGKHTANKVFTECLKKTLGKQRVFPALPLHRHFSLHDTITGVLGG